MPFIIIDKDSKEQMRNNMREEMRRGYRGGNYKDEHAYREGYKHGWEDAETEHEEYRRSRDSRGRYI